MLCNRIGGRVCQGTIAMLALEEHVDDADRQLRPTTRKALLEVRLEQEHGDRAGHVLVGPSSWAEGYRGFA